MQEAGSRNVGRRAGATPKGTSFSKMTGCSGAKFLVFFSKGTGSLEGDRENQGMGCRMRGCWSARSVNVAGRFAGRFLAETQRKRGERHNDSQTTMHEKLAYFCVSSLRLSTLPRLDWLPSVDWLVGRLVLELLGRCKKRNNGPIGLWRPSRRADLRGILRPRGQSARRRATVYVSSSRPSDVAAYHGFRRAGRRARGPNRRNACPSKSREPS
jgi:hypothetical protein